MKNKILSNISFNFLIKAITYTFSALAVLYVARVLQPEAFGRISFASSFAGYFLMIANLGMPIYAMRAAAQKRENRAELSAIFHELWSIHALLSAAGMAVFLIVILVVPRLREDLPLLLIYGSAIIFQMIGCEWLYRGLEKYRLLAVTSFVCKAVSLLLIVLFVHSQSDTVLYAILSVLTGYGSSIVCFLLLPRFVDLDFRVRINRAHFKPLLIFFMMSCAVYVYSSLDLTMIGFMKGDYETGLYSVSAKGRAVLTMTGGVVWNAVLPTATNLWKDGKKAQFESLARRVIAGVCGVQLLVTLACFLFAQQIILIIGGNAYLGAVPSFRILLLSLVPVGASNILGGQVLIPAGKEKRLLRAEILGAVFNFIANLLLIPRFSIEGAAVTTVLSEIIVWFVCLYYVKKDLEMDLGWDVVKRAARAACRRLRASWFRAMSRIRGDCLPCYCPCCEVHLRSFVDGGFLRHPDTYNPDRYTHIKQEVCCPVCGAIPRHRIMASWCSGHMDLLRSSRILYFAPERSMMLWMGRNGISVTTADLYHDADLQLDIEETGLSESSYDLIVCNHVLEHVIDYRRALREIYRILTPGGSFLCSFPMDPNIEYLDEDPEVKTDEERRQRFGQTDHNRVFGMKADELLEQAGFDVEKIRGDDCPEEILPVIGPADYDRNILFWCVRQ